MSWFVSNLEKELQQPESLKNPQTWQGLLQQQLDALRKDASAIAEDAQG